MSFEVKVGDDGRLELAADILEQAGLKAGDLLTIREDGEGRLLIRSRRQILREVQARFKALVPPGVSLVDELIADRRAEAAREDADEAEWARSRDLR